MPEITLCTWAGINQEHPTVLQLFEAHRGLPLKSTTRPDEKPSDLPLVAFGAFDQLDRKGPGCRGTNLNPEGIHCIALDYDDLTAQEATEVLARAKRFNPEGLAHTTWNHGLTKAKRDPEQLGVRFRVVMPLGKPVARSAWDAVWSYANDALGGLADGQCKNIDRFYFLPCVNLDAPRWVLSQDGGCWFESWGL